MARPIHIMLADLDRAWRKHELTPSWIDTYAMTYDVSVAGLYALAHKNSIPIDIEIGRNDHLLNPKTWDTQINESKVQDALDRESAERFRRFRANREDGRPAALRRASKSYAPFKSASAPAAQTKLPGREHVCGANCTTCR